MFQIRERKSPFIHLNDAANRKPGVVCEPFYVLSYYIGCPFECSYCYLQGTFRGQVTPVIYSNRERLLEELEEWLARPGRLRLNAGELEDSLALDGKIPLVEDLVPRFAAQDRHTLLLVTKSANVGNLLRYNPRRRVIVAFSVNSEEAWKRFEHKTPHPFMRIEAAARVREAGYITVLRLDPMLPTPDWQKGYRELIKLAYKLLQPDQWTLRSLRFFPQLPHWTGRLGRDTSVYNFGVKLCREDGRYRLREDTRLALYRFAVDVIRNIDPDVPIKLCKEIWGIHEKVGIQQNRCCYATEFDA